MLPGPQPSDTHSTPKELIAPIGPEKPPSEPPSTPKELIEPIGAEKLFLGYTQAQLDAFRLNVAGKLGTSFLTHPIFRASVLQTTRAKDDALLSAYQAIMSLNKTGGPLKGLSAGMLREAMKAAVRGPIQVSASKLAAILFPDNPTARGFTIGVFGGIVPAFFVQPLERYKTHATAQENKTNFIRFTKAIWNLQQGKFSAKTIGFVAEIYKAYFKTAGKETLMQASTYVALPWATQLFAPYAQDNPQLAKIGASSLAGFFAALVGAPLDVLKNLAQKGIGSKETTTEAVKTIWLKAYEQHMKIELTKAGIPALQLNDKLAIARNVASRMFAGVPLKGSLTMVSYSIAAYIMAPVLGLNNSHDKPPPASPPPAAPPTRIMDDVASAESKQKTSFFSFDNFRSKPSSSRVDDGSGFGLGKDVTEVDDLCANFRAFRI